MCEVATWIDRMSSRTSEGPIFEGFALLVHWFALYMTVLAHFPCMCYVSAHTLRWHNDHSFVWTGLILRNSPSMLAE